MNPLRRILLACLLALPWPWQADTLAQTTGPDIGLVVMHGKGGSPTARHMTPFVAGLESKSFLVANLEMPWSGRREYDVDVAAAEKEVTAALEGLRARGAKKVFVAGHSQGGVFALYYASRNPLDGVIAIAPGGSVDAPVYAQYVGSALSQAQRMVAEGKGSERGTFKDYEGSKGTNDVHTTAAVYVSWFDPNGAMKQGKSSRAIPATLPVLYIAPRNDYPGLIRIKSSMFGALPSNPLTKMADVDSDHLNAPRNSIDEIARWIGEVAGK